MGGLNCGLEWCWLWCFVGGVICLLLGRALAWNLTVRRWWGWVFQGGCAGDGFARYSGGGDGLGAAVLAILGCWVWVFVWPDVGLDLVLRLDLFGFWPICF